MDSTTVHVDPDQSLNAARMRQLLSWVLVVCAVIGVAEIALGLALGNNALLLLSALSLGMSAAAVGAQLLIRRNSLSSAVMLLAAAGVIISLGVTMLVPAIMPGLITVPLVMVLLLLPYMSRRLMPVMVAVSLGSALAIYLIGSLMPPFVVQPPPEVLIFITALVVVGSGGIALLLLWQFSGRLMATLEATQAANAALQVAQTGLEEEVMARTADLRTALAEVEEHSAAQAALLAENSQQREVIREMSVPVLPVSATTLVMPLIGALDSERLRDAQEQALSSVEQMRARRLILDITGVPVVDTQVAQGIVETVKSLRLLGAEAVLVGIRPEVAQTMVGLGLTLGSIRTAADVQSALHP